jgi:hypothetical protein
MSQHDENSYKNYKFDPSKIIDRSAVDYGKRKVCAWQKCTTVLNHYRAQETDFCSVCEIKAMTAEDEEVIAKARAKKKRENKLNYEKHKKKKLSD